MSTVLTKSLPAPPFCEREALRYAGCRAADGQTTGLLHACLDQAQDALAYRVCYTVSPVEIREAEVTFEGFTLPSAQLSRNLAGCSRALVFAATVGVGIDRLIARAGALSPAKGLMFQAIGAERIESLCDSFCALFEQEQDGLFVGHAKNYVRVYAEGRALQNMVRTVRVTSLFRDGVRGELLPVQTDAG